MDIGRCTEDRRQKALAPNYFEWPVSTLWSATNKENTIVRAFVCKLFGFLFDLLCTQVHSTHNTCTNLFTLVHATSFKHQLQINKEKIRHKKETHENSTIIQRNHNISCAFT